MQLRELQLIKEYSGTVYFGDCLHVMQDLSADSVDLIVTSPPYANMRAHTYGGIDHDLYVPWFCERAEQMLRILRPTGSFVLNIKEDVVEGQRHTYVLELILAMKSELGFRWVDEYIWHKSDPYPGKLKYRLKDGFERLARFLHGAEGKTDIMNTSPALQISDPSDLDTYYVVDGTYYRSIFTRLLIRRRAQK